MASSVQYAPYLLWTPEGMAEGEALPSTEWYADFISTFTKTTYSGIPYIRQVKGDNLSGATYWAHRAAWGTFSNVDVIADVMGPPETTSNIFGPMVRAQVNYGRAGYYSVLGYNKLSIYRQDPGTSNVRTEMASVELPNPPFTERWRVRLRADGSTISAKAWKRDTTEPEWMVTTVDSTYSSGYVGMAGWGRGWSVIRTFTELRAKEI